MLTHLFRRPFVLAGVAVLGLLMSTQAVLAQEAVIRKNIAERVPNFPPIDEVTKMPMSGLYELRIGNDVVYTDEQGSYIIEGTITDTKTRANLTEARIAKLTAIDFASLPLHDAVVWTQGTGARKMVIFADPNCTYCKHLEHELLQVKDLTVYTFLYPILGGDSPAKSRDIWCAKESGKVWRDWMIDGKVPPHSDASCDASALQRNTAFGQKHHVNATPSLVFEDSSRISGALPADQVEKHLLVGHGKT